MTEKSKILIVDDKVENLVAFKKILEDVDAEVITKTNGNDALKTLLNYSFALIILDVMMPEMDGYELAELIRGQRETNATPLIFLTAMDSTEKRIFRGYQAGAVDYIFKPVDDYIFINKVSVFISLDQQKKELERSNRDLEVFAEIASHDIKAPLRKIQNIGDFLKEDFQNVLSPKGIEYVNKIQNLAHRLSNLTDSLMEYSRITKGSQYFEPIDLKEIILKVLDNLELQIKETNGQIKVGDLPTIKGEPYLLIQLFQNLIGNALKYHRKNEPPVININSDSTEDGHCKICVKDNGIGFKEDYAKEIFKPFKRLVNKSEYEGDGIGLATCLKIAEYHRGNITCTSQLGEGSAFTVTFPKD